MRMAFVLVAAVAALAVAACSTFSVVDWDKTSPQPAHTDSPDHM
jgi:hypothetical protein